MKYTQTKNERTDKESSKSHRIKKQKSITEKENFSSLGRKRK
jgi:hypothetical protein